MPGMTGQVKTYPPTGGGPSFLDYLNLNEHPELLAKLPKEVLAYLMALVKGDGPVEPGGGGGWASTPGPTEVSHDFGPIKPSAAAQATPRYAASAQPEFGPPERQWSQVSGNQDGRGMSFPSGPMGNAAALAMLDKRGAYPDEASRAATMAGRSLGNGGPDDMVRQAIMEHLRYMLAPDRSAAPLGNTMEEMSQLAGGSSLASRPQATRQVWGQEYANLDYDTALSNPRAMDAVGPLMDLYGKIDQRGQQSRQFESSMADAEARRAYTGAQARNIERGGNVRSNIVKVATLAYNARKWVDTEVLKAERDASQGIDINLGGEIIKASEAPAIIAAIRKNVEDANHLLELANQAGDVRTANEYANQAAVILSRYEKALAGAGTGQPAPGGAQAPGGSNLDDIRAKAGIRR